MINSITENMSNKSRLNIFQKETVASLNQITQVLIHLALLLCNKKGKELNIYFTTQKLVIRSCRKNTYTPLKQSKSYNVFKVLWVFLMSLSAANKT